MGAPAIEARGLHVVCEGRAILRGVSLAVQPGERVSIEGPSGSGKSTLVRAMATLIPFDAGQVLLGGVDSGQIPPTLYRRRVAYVSQQAPMLPGSVHQNVAAGPMLHGEELSAAQVEALLQMVGLEPAFASREARSLSGGERQRVALARALANAPEVLLLDEPTAALDPEAALRVLTAVRTLADAGRAVVMVTHAAEHARALGGRLYRCEAGQLQPTAEAP